MLARRTIIKHSSGINIKTPLFVPSFSSKGFKFNEHGESEINRIYGVMEEILTESMLISAYDGYYKHIESETYPTNIVFVDSGGYETSDDHDHSEVMRTVGPIKEWNREIHKDYINSLPEYVSAVLISYDHGKERHKLEEQVKYASELFSKFPHQISNFLIKPETREQSYVNIDSVIKNIEKLKSFDIIGLTEKELGNSILSRMENISKLRMALDENAISAPLHIFGSLDPISSCLYFISGAEIFDGLTWLKYSFYEGKAVYRQNAGVYLYGLNKRDDNFDALVWKGNIYYLEELQSEMESFLLEGDYSKFSEHQELLSSAYDKLCGKLGRRV